MVIERVVGENECLICRDGMEGRAQGRMATCQHKFHADCIRTALLGTSSCPMCHTVNRSIMVEGPAEPLHEETFFDIVPIMREKCLRCLRQNNEEQFQCFGCAFKFHTACDMTRLVVNNRVSYCTICKDNRELIRDVILDRLDEEERLVSDAVRELEFEEQQIFDMKVIEISYAFLLLEVEAEATDEENGNELNESDDSD